MHNLNTSFKFQLSHLPLAQIEKAIKLYLQTFFEIADVIMNQNDASQTNV